MTKTKTKKEIYDNHLEGKGFVFMNFNGVILSDKSIERLKKTLIDTKITNSEPKSITRLEDNPVVIFNFDEFHEEAFFTLGDNIARMCQARIVKLKDFKEFLEKEMNIS